MSKLLQLRLAQWGWELGIPVLGCYRPSDLWKFRLIKLLDCDIRNQNR